MESAIQQGFLTGASLMPLIPYISDTTEQLDLTFSAFKKLGADYVLPATITLFGNAKADSKTLMFRAIQKHFPELEGKYNRLFENGAEMPLYYRKAFKKKMKELSSTFGLKDSILEAAIAKNKN